MGNVALRAQELGDLASDAAMLMGHANGSFLASLIGLLPSKPFRAVQVRVSHPSLQAHSHQNNAPLPQCVAPLPRERAMWARRA